MTSFRRADPVWWQASEQQIQSDDKLQKSRSSLTTSFRRADPVWWQASEEQIQCEDKLQKSISSLITSFRRADPVWRQASEEQIQSDDKLQKSRSSVKTSFRRADPVWRQASEQQIQSDDKLQKSRPVRRKRREVNEVDAQNGAYRAVQLFKLVVWPNTIFTTEKQILYLDFPLSEFHYSISYVNVIKI